MYWYLKKHAEDVYEELQAKVEVRGVGAPALPPSYHEQQITKIRSWVEEKKHMPNPHRPEEADMYWYLRRHAEDVYEELHTKTRDLQNKQIQIELDAFRKEQGHMPRELSDWTPERRLGMKVRREAPDLRDSEHKEEKSSSFKAFLEDFREFSERNGRTPRRTSDNENERHLAIRLDHARRGHGFFPLDPETVARDVRKTEERSVSARTSKRLEWQRQFEEAAKEKQEEVARAPAQDDAFQYAESE